MQSRYYDPEIGRFINADGYVSTGQGILSYNMFAYCLNDPIRFADDSGTRCVEDRPDGRWAMVTNSGRVVFSGRNKKTSNSRLSQSYITINDFKNNDGSYSLYDNRRHAPNNVFHEQILSVEALKPTISLKDGNVTLGSASATLMTGGWEIGLVDLSLLDIGQAKLAAGFQNGTFDVSALASAWVPSVTITLWDVSITISAHVGSIGAKFNVGTGAFDIGAAYGWGASVSVDW